MIDIAAWGAAITAVLTTIFGFFKWLLPFLRARRKLTVENKVQMDVEEGLRRHRLLYASLRSLEDHGIQRSVIFAGHNDGGIPRPGTPFYVSALHWMIDRRDRDTPDKYQHLPVDTKCIELLLRTKEQGNARFTTADMEPCQMRDVYEAEGITDSFVASLGVIDKKLFFLSAAVFSGKLTPDQITEIKIQANRISDLIHPAAVV